MKKLFSLGTLLALCLVSFQSNANLITNGSFEDFGGQMAPSTFPDGFGVYATIPGWTGFDSIEIHPSGFLGNVSQDGKHHAELNADPSQPEPFRLEQSFATTADSVYKLSFYAQQRQRDDGSFFVSAGDLNEEISSSNSLYNTDTWTFFEFIFNADSAETTLSFLSGQSGSDTIGHFLDNIHVSQVPLPGAAVLLLGGLLGLSAFRRKDAATA